jgi:23S rRNA pseudoU1915 N3-methylase RlmH
MWKERLRMRSACNFVTDGFSEDHLALDWQDQEQFLHSLIEDYWKRLRHFCELSLIEIRAIQEDAPIVWSPRKGKILAKIQPEDFLVLWTLKGSPTLQRNSPTSFQLTEIVR